MAAFVVKESLAGARYFTKTTVFPASMVVGPVRITSEPETEIPVGSHAAPPFVTPKLVVFTAGRVDPKASL